MVVASMTWELKLPGCASLKEKRSAVKSLKDRIRHRFNVSVSETAHQDVRDRAQLSVALVTTDTRFADTLLDHVDHFVAGHTRVIVVSARREVY